MPKKISSHSPAFPLPVGFIEEGMSIRTYLAAKAMQAIITGCGDANGNITYEPISVAQSAVEMADALIKELNI